MIHYTIILTNYTIRINTTSLLINTNNLTFLLYCSHVYSFNDNVNSIWKWIRMLKHFLILPHNFILHFQNPKPSFIFMFK